MGLYQIVKDRYQELINKIDEIRNDVELLNILEEMKKQIEFDEDCALHGH